MESGEGLKTAIGTEAMPPRQRLLLAGEALFAESGIEGVSLREIAIAAGNGNNNAVQYYFGSKQGLAQAIFEHRVAQMEPVRLRMLEKAEAAGRLRDAHTLVEMICLPHLDLVDEHGRHPYAGFLSQYLLRYQPAGMPHFADSTGEGASAVRRVIDLLVARIDYVPRPIALSRIALSHLMFLGLITRADVEARDRSMHADLPELVDDMIETIVAGYTAPYRGWPAAAR